MNFLKELEQLINKYSIDNECETPDFILAKLVEDFLKVIGPFVRRRDNWKK